MKAPIYSSDNERALLKSTDPAKYVTAGKGPIGNVLPVLHATYAAVSFGSTLTFPSHTFSSLSKTLSLPKSERIDKKQ